MGNKKGVNVHKASETAMVKALDDLNEFDQFKQTVLPKLRKAVAENWSVERIYKEFGAMVAAKVITTALTDQDSGKALTASKEILDRALGKSKERVEVTRYDKLGDDELDQLLNSTLQSVAGEDSDEQSKH